MWKDIECVKDAKYEISTEGKVRNKTTGRILKPEVTVDGYLRVQLGSDRKRYYVHRLVAEAFIPNPAALPLVNHKDEDPGNPSVDNLEWSTHRHNTTHSCGKAVLQYKDGILVGEYTSCASAAESLQPLGIKSNIAKVCRGEMNTHRGFVWKYKD